MLRALKHWAGGLSGRDSDKQRELHCNTYELSERMQCIMHSGVTEVSQSANSFYLRFNSGDRGGHIAYRQHASYDSNKLTASENSIINLNLLNPPHSRSSGMACMSATGLASKASSTWTASAIFVSLTQSQNWLANLDWRRRRVLK